MLVMLRTMCFYTDFELGQQLSYPIKNSIKTDFVKKPKKNET